MTCVNKESLRNKMGKLKMACIYHPGLSDWRGGAAGLKNILHIFEGLGIETTNVIACTYDSNKFHIEHRKIEPSISSITMHLPSYLPKFVKASSIFFGFIYAWRPIKKCDIIFAHPSITSAVPAVILGKIFNKSIIFHYVDVELLPIPNVIYKYIFGRADSVLAISPYLIDKAKKYGCENIIYLPAFVDTNLFKMDMNIRKRMRANLGIKDTEVVIGYAGSFSYTEGVSYLLQAFRNLLRSYPNVRLIIVGGMKHKRCEDIRKLAESLNLQDKVSIVPPQPHEEIPGFLSACDITCCPKIDCEENRAAHPIKVVEYLSMGLPTVCSSVGGITYTIEDRINGFLVKPGDVTDLEAKLEWVILNPEHSKRIGKNGRKKAIKEYSFGAIESRVRESVSTILDTRKKINREVNKKLA